MKLFNYLPWLIGHMFRIIVPTGPNGFYNPSRSQRIKNRKLKAV